MWKLFDPQCSIASFWSASVIEYRHSLNWEERIRVYLIMEQSGDGFAMLVVVPVFFFQKCGGEDGLLLINRL